MLTISRQPRFYCPNSKSRPVRWQVDTDEHIVLAGLYPFFSVTFDTTPAINGEAVDIAGVTFTVDNSTPYTETTWSTTGTTQEVATNFMNMLRCNYRFADFQFYLTFGGLSATANGFSNKQQEEDPWTFDVSGLSLTASYTQQNGREPDLKDLRLWYQVYEEDIQIGGRKQAFIPYDQNFPYYGSVPIDATEELRAVLRSRVPDLNTTGPVNDQTYQRLVHLRFGTVEFDDSCNDTYGKVYKSLEVFITNSVFQLHYTREFLTHCPNAASQVKFLTDRPAEMTICRTSYEWVHIWLEHTAVWVDTGMPWYIVFRFFDSDGVDLEEDYSQAIYQDRGAALMSVGPWNLGLRTQIPDDAAYYTVRVFGWREQPVGDPQLRQYSETITRHLASCNCKAAEVYFLEDRGSWRTIVFETLEQREVDAIAAEFEQPLNFDYTTRGWIYPDGERYNYVEDADQIFTLATGRITEKDRSEVEQLLRSPEVYIRTAGDVGEALRRIIPDRQRTTTFQRGGATKIIIPFRFNTRLRTH